MMSMMFNRPMRSLKRRGEERGPRCYEMRRGNGRKRGTVRLRRSMCDQAGACQGCSAAANWGGGLSLIIRTISCFLHPVGQAPPFGLYPSSFAFFSSPALTLWVETWEGDGVVGSWSCYLRLRRTQRMKRTLRTVPVGDPLTHATAAHLLV